MSTFVRPLAAHVAMNATVEDHYRGQTSHFSLDPSKLGGLSPEAMIRAYCRPLATTKEKLQIWQSVSQETNYGLFPSYNMLQSDEMQHLVVAETIDAKRLVITNIIPALSRSDSVKKGDALKVQEFTRCRVVKCYSPYSCYSYIDVDTIQGVHEAEYERRYLMYLCHVRQTREQEAAMMNTSSDSESKSVSEERDEPCVQSPFKALPPNTVLSPKNVNSNGIIVMEASDEKEKSSSSVEMIEHKAETKESACSEEETYCGDEESKDDIRIDAQDNDGQSDGSDGSDEQIIGVNDVNDEEDLAYARLLHRIEISKSQYLYDKMVIEIKSKAIEGMV